MSEHYFVIGSEDKGEDFLEVANYRSLKQEPYVCSFRLGNTWAGDSETGFGAETEIAFTKDQIENLICFLEDQVLGLQDG